MFAVAGRGERPVDQVTGPDPVLARDRGSLRPAADHPVQAAGAHEPLDGAAGDGWPIRCRCFHIFLAP